MKKKSEQEKVCELCGEAYFRAFGKKPAKCAVSGWVGSFDTPGIRVVLGEGLCWFSLCEEGLWFEVDFGLGEPGGFTTLRRSNSRMSAEDLAKTMAKLVRNSDPREFLKQWEILNKGAQVIENTTASSS